MRCIQVEFENDADYRRAQDMFIEIQDEHPLPPRKPSRPTLAAISEQADMLAIVLAESAIPHRIVMDRDYPPKTFGFED